MATQHSLGTLQLPPLMDDRDKVLWPALLDLAAELPQPWALIGGQMVYLHGVLAGRSPHRVTEDIDLIFDIRFDVQAIAKAHSALEKLGYEVNGISADGLAHRYTSSQGVDVDILAPDNLGERAPAKLSTPYGKTVQVPGGTQALQNACAIDAVYAGRTGTLFVPDLLTAVDNKVKAMNLPGPTDGSRSRHLDDVAFLVSLVDDPDALLNDPATTSLRLATASTLDEATHPSWRRLGEHAEDGFAVWEIFRAHEQSS